MDFFKDYYSLIFQSLNSLSTDLLVQAAEMLKNVRGQGKKVMLAGNGGSAATATHLTVDLLKANKIRAMNFNEADLITCFANDYGYEHWITKAVEAYGDSQDLVILLSISGKSPNVLNAARRAKELGISVITLSACQPDNPLRQVGDLNFWLDSRGSNIVEMTHHIWLVSIVDYIVGKVEYSSN